MILYEVIRNIKQQRLILEQILQKQKIDNYNKSYQKANYSIKRIKIIETELSSIKERMIL